MSNENNLHMTPRLTHLMPGRTRLLLAFECGALFIGLPTFVSFHATHLNVAAALLSVAIYGLALMAAVPGQRWRHLWHGEGWSIVDRKIALMRFLVLSAVTIIFAHVIAPSHLFTFPMQRPFFWLVVMVLYPVFSVIPQEFVLRNFFFSRYAALFTRPWAMITASALGFSFMHVVFHNLVAPLMCLIGGFIFAHSFSRHRSLKWVVVEHAGYGCMVFTVGIGYYFLLGGLRM